MSYPDVPIWEKYTLTIEEAAKYFRIGEKKLRKLAEENPDMQTSFSARPGAASRKAKAPVPRKASAQAPHKQRVSFGGTGSIRPMLTARAWLMPRICFSSSLPM